MRLGIRSKLFLCSIGLIGAAMMAVDVYLATALDADLVERVRRELLVRLHLAEGDASAFGAALDDRASWDRLADELGRRGEGRVTIIGRDGAVLGDSELDLSSLARLESHSDRPEIVQALSLGHGASVRWSSTSRQRMIYAAVPFHWESIVAGTVRLAKPLNEVDEAVAHLRRLVYLATAGALGLAALLTMLTSHWMSKTVRALTAAARRMAAGDLDVRTRATGHDELAELGRALDQLASGLQGAFASLRCERDLTHRVLEGMQEGVLMLDEHGRIALANAALRTMLLLETDAVGKSPLEVIRNSGLKRLLDGASSSLEPVSAELELGDLKRRRVLARAAALGGSPKGVLAVFVDVTELRRLEVVRREFVANVSHELRTPVAAVRSAAETLRRAIETQPEAAVEFAAMIERNADRLQRLIDDLLDLSRIESRELRLDLDTVDLAAVVGSALTNFEERAGAKGIRLCPAIPAGLAVRADRRAIDLILSNLIDNAVKYCNGGACVTVSAERADAKIRVAVEDTGPGIEARHLSRLFERFYRVDAGRSREVGGTGLGLSIVKHLVEAMEGRVAVESQPGKGSSFSFTLKPA